MDNLKASYNCSQPTLYLALLLLAENAKLNRVKLNSYKNKYDDDFFENFITMVEEAQALPNEQARAVVHENLRLDLVGYSKTCHQNFQMTKGYIEEAFEQHKWINNFKLAGWQYFDSTSWDDCKEMNHMLKSYLAENIEKLQTEGYMSPTFVTKVTADAKIFSDGLSAFLLAEEKARTGTQQKLEKNNSAHAAGIAIAKDGTMVAHIQNDPAMAELFSFEALCALVKPAAASTLIVDISNSETEMPLAGAQLKITGSDKTGTSNGDGRIEISQLPAENIKGAITADGFSEKPFTATLTGVTTRLKIIMNPMFSGEMNVGSDNSPQSTLSSGQMAGMRQ